TLQESSPYPPGDIPYVRVMPSRFLVGFPHRIQMVVRRFDSMQVVVGIALTLQSVQLKFLAFYGTSASVHQYAHCAAPDWQQITRKQQVRLLDKDIPHRNQGALVNPHIAFQLVTIDASRVRWAVLLLHI